MKKAEAGQRGGLVTKENHGITFCPTCHQPVEPRYYQTIGREGGLVGGNVLKARYGNKYFSDIGKLGGRGNTREKREKNQSKD